MNDHNAELVTWSSTFACGIKPIDDQHRELINLVNDMFNHVTGNEYEEHEYLNKIIQKTVRYVKVHFATEEKIMTLARFSGYAEHKKAHDEFVVMVIDSFYDVACHKKINLYAFTKFLKDWILSHIAVMDKQYFEYFRKIATRKANGRMSVTPADVQTAPALKMAGGNHISAAV